MDETNLTSEELRKGFYRRSGSQPEGWSGDSWSRNFLSLDKWRVHHFAKVSKEVLMVWCGVVVKADCLKKDLGL